MEKIEIPEYLTINDAPAASRELDKGVVWIDREINAETLHDFHMQLNWAVHYAKPKVVDVYICSPGGSVFEGMAMFDFIKATQTEHTVQINTIGLGYMASMCSLLFQAGTNRYVGPNAMCLIHKISVDPGQATTDFLEDVVELNRRLENKAVEIYCERSKLTPEMVSVQWKRKDWWLDADEMIKLGLADEILY